ncbi:hypothetical protein SEUCBS139899_002044 [Sporothrix eucalyptigena]|uniref:Enoyl reductase (ER) domain-containing protein n=1 Tax=Sporothrix eucalyptigena TaxID=1812306 RepID=A0ABP0CE85_9PEZI
MSAQLGITTEGLVVEAAGADFTMKPIELVDMNDDEVLVEMKYSGICHTDILLQHGLLPPVDFPAIFGHEGAGTVLKVGAAAAKHDPALRPGASVLLSFNTCGRCCECVANRPSFCHVHVQANAGCVRLRDGSTPARLAEASATPVLSQCFGQSSFLRTSVVAMRSVVVVPDALLADCTLDSGESILAAYAPLGCGFQTGAGTVLNVLRPTPADSVVIFGMGSVGLAALMAAANTGVRQLIAVDIVADKLLLARDFGATHMVNSRDVADVPAEVRRISDGGVTYAIDCTGIIPIIESLFACLAPGGTAASVGVPPPGKKVQIDALSFLMENKRFIGVIEGCSVPQTFIPQLIKLHRDGRFPVDKLIKVYSVRDFKLALADLRSGKVVKPVIKWD